LSGHVDSAAGLVLETFRPPPRLQSLVGPRPLQMGAPNLGRVPPVNGSRRPVNTIFGITLVLTGVIGHTLYSENRRKPAPSIQEAQPDPRNDQV